MSINLKIPDIRELKPRITVFGVGGAGGNAVNNMINAGLQGVDFVVANTDAQALTTSRAERIIQMGVQATEGLGAGSQPDVGCTAAQEVIDEIRDHLNGAHMVFVTAGMGGGTGTGASPVVAKAARELGILTVGVVTKPFHFEGQRRMRLAEQGILELQKSVDTLIIIPNQNLFRVANEKTTFADAFAMADQVLYSGVACITDLMVKEGLINLDFADVRAVMREMGKAMMGTGEASGDKRALRSAEAAICNPLIDDVSMRGARGLLISITGGKDLTLYEVDEAATRIREEVDPDANIIVGATFDDSLDGIIRVSVVATGVDANATAGTRPAAAQSATAPVAQPRPAAIAAATAAPRLHPPAETLSAEQNEARIAELAQRLKADNARVAERSERADQAALRSAAAPFQQPVQHPSTSPRGVRSGSANTDAAIHRSGRNRGGCGGLGATTRRGGDDQADAAEAEPVRRAGRRGTPPPGGGTRRSQGVHTAAAGTGRDPQRAADAYIRGTSSAGAERVPGQARRTDRHGAPGKAPPHAVAAPRRRGAGSSRGRTGAKTRGPFCRHHAGSRTSTGAGGPIRRTTRFGARISKARQSRRSRCPQPGRCRAGASRRRSARYPRVFAPAG